MGKGLAQRRRLRAAERAKTEKKGKTFIAGSGGKKRKQESKDDLKDVPSSFRKLLKLKAAADGLGGVHPAHPQQQQRKQQQRPGPGAGQAAKGEAAAELKLDDHSAPPQHAALGGPPPSQQQPGQQRQDAEEEGQQQQGQQPHKQEAQDQQKLEQQEQGQQQRGQQAQQRGQKRGQQQRGQQQHGQQPQGGQLFKTKALRADKKEYLKLKKLKKKGKLPGGEGGLVDKERELLAKESFSRPQFGEQAAAPIEANLKRRHWVDQQERSAAQRCKEVFMKQMQGAEAAAAAAAAVAKQRQVQQQQRGGSSGLAAVKPGKAAGKPGSQAAGRAAAAAAKPGGKPGKAAPAAGKPGKAGNASKVKSKVAVPESERLALIEAYRETKRRKLEAAGRGLSTTATPQSLADLVKRDAAAAAAAAQLH